MSDNIHKSPVALSDDSSETFLIRWRGRQEGPYTAAVIDAKLAANQIGLLHEISHKGQWVTLREFFVERDALLRAEDLAREEERHAKREAERLETERREKQRAEALELARLKAAESESVRLPQYTEDYTQATKMQASRGSPGFRASGIVLLVVGLIIALSFFLGYETSVETGFGRVINFGLLADRQNGVLLGLGLAVIGVLLIGIGMFGDGYYEEPAAPLLWNPRAAVNWSLLFSPAFGAFLQSRNFQAMGRMQEAKVSQAWVYFSLAFSCAGFILKSAIPAIPDPVFSAGALILLCCWYFTSGLKQIKHIDASWQNRYRRKPWTGPLLIGFGCLTALIVAVQVVADIARSSR